ncbi:3-oxoadipate enol-lactonase [Agrobacterium rhizogenes]|jgi:3-oxoadipate enol-lactonase|uniref:3-oxoadipate enol-lactonase n=1 Tax=Rhizobium rhizogenes TaxID=359 RepID=UPI00068E5CC8|nr:3-oxoadipate enol-lactonase [Rhizobium rhizogenes]OCJ04592.1 3-oxoadipate enol-lactonase [Agrobacterium sp. 13-626]OCJ23671.1 3-oxoadipate enol-lactonase [Agrobacterium sp. B131/95]OCJ30049.1 3-oxoadipate enol-lactonase [Agrobacterium sp. B133/95]MDJ1635226.1 3-oxoadipate enol-lactonase [Rhizobium rhizogenes]MQB35034.1 3-oxoadipate enol-lactonase [Rhizobium rhizogenes]
MPHFDLKSHRLHYRIDGDADAAGEPWLMFCNSLGADLHMWDAQVAALSRHYRILRYDRRGHGLSSVPPPPYALSDLGNDVIALLDALEIERTHFCGLSIGGLVGQWLGIHAGHRLDRIIVCATSAKIGTTEGWVARMEAVREHGLDGLAAATTERWFSPAFETAEPKTIRKILDSFVTTTPAGYIGCCAALADGDLREEVERIANPLLAISGEDDPVCPPADLERIAVRVRRGRHVSLRGRHIVNVESASAFNTILANFLDSNSQPDVSIWSAH